MRKLVVLVALILCPALSAGNINKKLPDLARTVSAGCYINQVLDDRTKQRMWQVRVWARYVGSKQREDWELWYSIRKKRMKAFADCDRWLKMIAKKQKASRLPSR